MPGISVPKINCANFLQDYIIYLVRVIFSSLSLQLHHMPVLNGITIKVYAQST